MLAKSRLQTIICSSRLQEAEAFYRDALGLTLKGKSDGALVFDVGGADLRVSPVPPQEPGEHTVAGFAVGNLESCMAELTERGVRFERFPGFPHAEDGSLVTPDGSVVAWFRDPDGNLLSVVQYTN